MPPIRTFTLNDPYALEALCDRTPSMLPRVRKEYPKEVLTDEVRARPTRGVGRAQSHSECAGMEEGGRYFEGVSIFHRTPALVPAMLMHG